MNFDWNSGPLAEGLRCYESREFFLAHEHWEGVWLACTGREKAFLQGMIQIAAAFHHLQRGNPIGCASLLRAALRRLDPLPSPFGGVETEPLRSDVRAWLAALDRHQSSPALPYPRIC